MTPKAPRGLRGLALAQAGAALALVVAGSLVNSQQAALSVPDWPLSYGRLLMTRWPGGTAWEQLHRLLAAVNLLLAVPLALGLRRWRCAASLRRLGSGLLGLLLLQILLGCLVVLTLDPPAIAVVHVALAHAFAATAIVTWWRMQAEPTADRGPAPPAGRPLHLLFWLLAVQILLGALSRHPPVGTAGFVVALLAHSLLGLAAVGLAIGAGIGQLRRRARAAGALLVALGVAQLAVAGGVFIVAPEPLAETWPPPVAFPALHGAHHLLAALLLGTASVLRWRRPSA